MTPVFFAHGAGATPADAPLPELTAALGNGYAITAPSLGDPDPAHWSRRLKAALTDLPPSTILVGHSLGASHLLKCLAELGPMVAPRGMIGLACPDWSGAGWDASGYALPDWAPEALARLPIRLFHARDDEVVPFAHLAALGAALPNARCYPLPSGGHALTGALSPVAVAIAEL
ncbi:alpha/beta fold hydrolase [Oceanicola sp. 22II-s10i]|uniref:alpha/beta fold hydrolase n=1 Tax=Oceanicola sp. 22II-s10i TaxID=1317116 RepID=UPI000B5288EF|nr:alpha/beta fold hydrolase [Oceanicola sp. 22II-s10i]